MDATAAYRSPRWWPWALAILGVIVLNAFFIGSRGGECFDYVVESGASGTCTSGPMLGIEGTWILGVVSAVAVVYFARRVVRIVSARATREEQL
jgi:hypothetical protein